MTQIESLTKKLTLSRDLRQVCTDKFAGDDQKGYPEVVFWLIIESFQITDSQKVNNTGMWGTHLGIVE